MTTLETSTAGELLNHHDEQVRRITAGWLIGQRSKHTRRAYQKGLEVWLTWCHEHRVDPVNPTRQEVQAWVTWMRDVRGYAPASIGARHGAIKSWHAELAVEGARPAIDVHLRLKLPHPVRMASTRLLTDDDVQRLVLAARAQSTPAETAILMMATMGLRASEAGTVHAGMIEASAHGPVLRITGKGGVTTSMPVPRVVLAAARRTRWPGWEIPFNPGADWTDRRVYRRVDRWARRAARRAGIDGFHCHMLRAWFITRALQLGVEERYVQAGARHASFDTTALYNRANDELTHHPTHTVAPLLEALVR